jgi:hypothetical protein
MIAERKADGYDYANGPHSIFGNTVACGDSLNVAFP